MEKAGWGGGVEPSIVGLVFLGKLAMVILQTHLSRPASIKHNHWTWSRVRNFAALILTGANIWGLYTFTFCHVHLLPRFEDSVLGNRGECLQP